MRVKTYNLSFSNFFLLAIERGIKEMAITLKKEMTGERGVILYGNIRILVCM
jgi:hypothetical protein